jgi:hypothetical protein
MVLEKPSGSPRRSSRQSICASTWTMVSGARGAQRLDKGDWRRIVAADHQRNRPGIQDAPGRLFDQLAVSGPVH